MQSSKLTYPFKELTLSKCILVTGSLGGIGRAIVSKFSELGVNIISVDRHNASEELPYTKHFKCDLSQEKEIHDLWLNLETEGVTIDCLINNAGIYTGTTWDAYDSQSTGLIMNINLIAPFLMSQCFAKQTKIGSIINISSVSAFCGSHDPLYGASKAGLIGLTKSLALCLGSGIRTNAIAPGIIDTPMKDKIPQAVIEKYHKSEQLNNPIQADAIADSVLYLASSLAKNITGATLDINNGVYLR